MRRTTAHPSLERQTGMTRPCSMRLYLVCRSRYGRVGARATMPQICHRFFHAAARYRGNTAPSTQGHSAGARTPRPFSAATAIPHHQHRRLDITNSTPRYQHHRNPTGRDTAASPAYRHRGYLRRPRLPGRNTAARIPRTHYCYFCLQCTFLTCRTPRLRVISPLLVTLKGDQPTPSSATQTTPRVVCTVFGSPSSTLACKRRC